MDVLVKYESNSRYGKNLEVMRQCLSNDDEIPSNYTEKKFLKYNEVPINQISDICLHLMMIPSDVEDLKVNTKSKMTVLLESLQNFEHTFECLYIVLDNTNKFKDVEDIDITFLIDAFKTNNIITQDATIVFHKMLYETKQDEYKEILMDIFNYNDIEKIKLERTYKNAFTYYYSFHYCPTKYMLHIDIPRPQRSKYIKNNLFDSKFEKTCYIKKSMHLLENYENVLFVGNISPFENFIKHPSFSPEQYAVYFDGKANISLQCFVLDSIGWKSNYKYSNSLYRYQTENAIANMLAGKRKYALGILPCDTSVLKVGF